MPARKQRILTADDDPQLLRLVARTLAFEDYDVLTASDGELALARIEVQQPDLVATTPISSAFWMGLIRYDCPGMII
jgi:CheY-like chemotaxis protein